MIPVFKVWLFCDSCGFVSDISVVLRGLKEASHILSLVVHVSCHYGHGTPWQDKSRLGVNGLGACSYSAVTVDIDAFVLSNTRRARYCCSHMSCLSKED